MQPRFGIFARAPVPGAVKTRLIPLLGAAGAARLYGQLLERVCATLARSGAWAGELWCAPDAGDPQLARLGAEFGLELHTQRGVDLGARMAHALTDMLARGPAAVLVGSDCVVLDPADLEAAFAVLATGADLVLAPADDGGYALIGVRTSPPAALFAGIGWGGSHVCADTLARAQQLRWSVRLLRRVWDVDRPEDLERLRALGWKGV